MRYECKESRSVALRSSFSCWILSSFAFVVKYRRRVDGIVFDTAGGSWILDGIILDGIIRITTTSNKYNVIY
jgi:hypothetical protein